MALRSELHRRGLRYRIHRPIEGLVRIRPDVVFVAARVAVFVDGCFWHRCPEHASDPKANARWWREKLARNVDRDRRTDSALKALGWKVMRVWEHEDPVAAARRVQAAIEVA
jgi:DNA mismatch endonuclease (patch repair protein)